MIDCLEQVRRFYPGDIHIIIPDKYVCKNFVKRIGVHPVAYESITGDPLYQEFQKRCFLDGFWNVTMARFIMLDVLMQRKGLIDVVHIENDVLIYNNPCNMLNEFRRVAGEKVLLTPVGDNYASGAYVYVRDIAPLRSLNDLFIEYMSKGKAFLKKILGTPDTTEMMLISYFYKHFENVINYLPIVPEGKGSNRFRIFNSLFDGASAGQYIGGTRSDGPGWTGKHHWLGKYLQQWKYSFEWRTNSAGLKVPFMVDKKGRKYQLNNLHIHCKDLKRYM
jgi:hypothetical protein